MLQKIWHRHQGLWNWDLVTALTSDIASAKPPKSALSWCLIWADTGLLLAKFTGRRLRRRLEALLRGRPPGPLAVTYIDVGTHVAAKELSLMRHHVLPARADDFRCIGIEANRESYERVRERMGDDPHVTLVHGAVCRQIPPDGHVQLYLHGDGHGDSLHRTSGASVQVPALRLSDLVRAEGADPGRVLVVRMNIEGAEFDALRDLHEQGLLDRIDAFYGMWDDLSKIDAHLDREMTRFMAIHGIRTTTFNERDFVSGFRVRAIAYDLATSIVWAARRRAP